MKGLRPLLRLDDKVAAEGRRLQNLGAHTSRWGGLTLLAAAAILHGAMLMLPALHVKATLPAASPTPDFPRVWRTASPALPPPPVVQEGAPAPEQAPPELSADVASRPASSLPTKPLPPRPISVEPVPEPVPALTMRMITAEVEENIPYPDAPPPPFEPGAPFATPPQSEIAPAIVVRTQPAYPAAARSLGAEGQVRLRLSLLPDGRVERATIVDCSRPGVGFEAAAAEAVKRWRYEAAPPASRPRSVIVTVEFRKQDARP